MLDFQLDLHKTLHRTFDLQPHKSSLTVVIKMIQMCFKYEVAIIVYDLKYVIVILPAWECHKSSL